MAVLGGLRPALFTRLGVNSKEIAGDIAKVDGTIDNRRRARPNRRPPARPTCIAGGDVKGVDVAVKAGDVEQVIAQHGATGQRPSEPECSTLIRR